MATPETIKTKGSDGASLQSVEIQPLPKSLFAQIMDTYSPEERTSMEAIIKELGGKFPFWHLSENNIDSIPKDVRYTPDEQQGKLKLVHETYELILLLRKNSIEKAPLDLDRFENFLDEHFDDPIYEFLQKKHPGITSNGWAVLRAIMDPLKHGSRIQRPGMSPAESTKIKQL